MSCGFVNCNKCAIQVEMVDKGGSCACWGGGGRGIREISVLSVHFCSESKTIKSVFKNGIKSQEAWEDGQGGQCPRAEKRTKDRRGCIHEEGEAEVGPANVTGGTLGARGIPGAAGRRRRRGREGCGASAASRPGAGGGSVGFRASFEGRTGSSKRRQNPLVGSPRETSP